MKEFLITSGFPRSGSTYLNQALHLLYYPNEEPNWNRHTVVAIENSNKIIVPFRNPLDCIASWHNYPSQGILESDIKFYIRFHTAILNNISKVVLMDFDFFTKDLDYIKDKVFKNFSIDTNRYVGDEQVKQAMLREGKEINLPRNNQEELTKIKKTLLSLDSFDKCVELFNQLKGQ